MNKLAGGKLFEPKSLAENKMVWEKAKSIDGNDARAYWIGVTDRVKEADFRYDSNNLEIPFSIIWYTSYGTHAGGKFRDCVGITYTGRWYDGPCSNFKYRSICEIKT